MLRYQSIAEPVTGPMLAVHCGSGTVWNTWQGAAMGATRIWVSPVVKLARV